MAQEKRDQWQIGGICPTPDKNRYPSKKAAKDWIRANRKGISNIDDTDIYHCHCGAFHLTTMPKPIHQKISKFLNRPTLKHFKAFQRLISR